MVLVRDWFIIGGRPTWLRWTRSKIEPYKWSLCKEYDTMDIWSQFELFQIVLLIPSKMRFPKVFYRWKVADTPECWGSELLCHSNTENRLSQRSDESKIWATDDEWSQRLKNVEDFWEPFSALHFKVKSVLKKYLDRGRSWSQLPVSTA